MLTVLPLATRIVTWSCVSRVDALCGNTVEILDRYPSLPKIFIDTECIGTNAVCMGTIPMMQRLVHVVPSRMSNTKVSTAPNPLCTSRIALFTSSGMIPCCLIDSFVAVWSLGASKRLG